MGASPQRRYYAHYVPQLHPDPTDEPLELGRLAMIKIPVLVIKPVCDYLPWSSLAPYQRAFPQAKFVMLPGAGHVAYLEQPELYVSLVHAFLTGQQLPHRPLTLHPSQTDTVALGDGVYPWP
jgi:pimeloyl-ACP methyl ester carboxylesterase